MTDPLLRADDLRLDYGATTALAGMSFEAHAGEAVAIMGPSGSGKTSLLRCLAGLQEPSEGTVRFEGQDVYGLSDKARSQLRLSRFGFVFQSAELVSELSLLENIALPVELNGQRRRAALRIAQEWADRLDLTESARRRPSKVSGGQRQRAAIARAMATAPAIVFADEPTGALDTTNRDRVLQLLKDSCTSVGSALVLVTHDPVAAERADRVVQVRDGQAAVTADTGLTGRAPL